MKTPNWLLFLGPSFIWGTTWVTIKLQLGVVAPEASVVYRFALATVLVFAWCRARGVSLAFDRKAHAMFAGIGFLQYSVNYVLVYLSELYLTSGLVAVVFAVIVFWNLAGARLFFGARLPAVVWLGSSVGMVGVALVFWPELSQFRGGGGELVGIALAVVATLAASASNLWSQRMYGKGIAVLPSTAWSMLYGTLAVALYAVVRGVPFTFDPRLPYVASLAYLAVFGSVIAFVGYLTLLKRIGAGRSGYTAVMIPVLAMASSTVFEGYRWSVHAAMGMGLVLAGTVMVVRGKTRA